LPLQQFDHQALPPGSGSPDRLAFNSGRQLFRLFLLRRDTSDAGMRRNDARHRLRPCARPTL